MLPLHVGLIHILYVHSGLKEWLRALTVNGVAVIEDAPFEKNACRRLAERVGFIRRTHYGEEFLVANEEGLPTTSNASQCKTLPMHTDMPYYEYKPGVNLLHCLVQTQSPGWFESTDRWSLGGKPYAGTLSKRAKDVNKHCCGLGGRGRDEWK